MKDKKEPKTGSITNEEREINSNVSFGDPLSRKISRTLDRPSTGSVITTRRSRKTSSRLGKRFAKSKDQAHKNDKLKDKFKSFNLPPRDDYKPAEPLIYSRKRVISKQYKEIK